MARFLVPFALAWLAAETVGAQAAGLTFSEERVEDASEDIPPPLPGEEAAPAPPGKTVEGKGAPPPTAPSEPEPEHPRGSYLGVKPGGAEHPAVSTGPGIVPSVVTWPGFAMRPDGGSRFFLQLTAPVDVAHQTLPNKVVVDLQGARIAGTNNRFPLETRFFNTPVVRALLKRNKGTTTLELLLRTPAQPRISSRAAPSGYHFLYVDFPPGDYLEEAPLAPGAEPAPAAGPPGAIQLLPPGERERPTHLPSGEETSGAVDAKARGGAAAKGQLSADTSMDQELPPGMGKVKVKGQAKVGGGLRLER